MMKFVKKNGIYIADPGSSIPMKCMGIEDQFPFKSPIVQTGHGGVLTPVMGGGGDLRDYPQGYGEEALTGNCILTASWTGSDEKNTGAGTGHVFSGSTAPDATKFNKSTDPYGWNGGEATTLKYSDTGGSSSQWRHSDHTFTGVAQASHRVYVYMGTVPNNLVSGQEFRFLQLNSATHTLGYVNIHESGGSKVIGGSYRESGLGWIAVTSTYIPSANTGYWVALLVQNNQAGGTGFVIKIWNAAGTTLLATLVGNTGTTLNEVVVSANVGGVYTNDSSGNANTIYFDSYMLSGGASQSILTPRLP